MLDTIRRMARENGLTLEQVTGDQRHARLVRVRRAIILELHSQGYSASAIGRRLNRDHTSVLYHIRKAEQELADVAP